MPPHFQLVPLAFPSVQQHGSTHRRPPSCSSFLIVKRGIFAVKDLFLTLHGTFPTAQPLTCSCYFPSVPFLRRSFFKFCYPNLFLGLNTLKNLCHICKDSRWYRLDIVPRFSYMVEPSPSLGKVSSQKILFLIFVFLYVIFCMFDFLDVFSLSIGLLRVQAIAGLPMNERDN